MHFHISCYVSHCIFLYLFYRIPDAYYGVRYYRLRTICEDDAHVLVKACLFTKISITGIDVGMYFLNASGPARSSKRQDAQRQYGTQYDELTILIRSPPESLRHKEVEC